MVGSQYFPLYLYDDSEPEAAKASPDAGRSVQRSQPALASATKRRDAITDGGAGTFPVGLSRREAISKEDLFYYVYGLLHSPDYRERYADNLGKELPRIPCVKTASDFWAFSARPAARWPICI
jgi:predicted helicase